MSNGGYIKVARNMVNSDIFRKPPLYLKVWMYLLCKAYYSPNGCDGNGELKTTIDEILEACSYQIGYRKVVPKREEIYRVFRHLRSENGRQDEDSTNGSPKEPMIETTNTKHYMRIKILNFEKYQDFESYYADEKLSSGKLPYPEHNDEANDERPCEGTHEAPSETKTGDQFLQLKKINNKYMVKFKVFWDAYPRKVKKQNAIKAFEKLKVDDELLAKMLDALEVQKQSSQWTKDGGQFIPHPATWLNAMQWEDETEVAQKDPLRMLEEGVFTLDPL